MSAMKEAMKAMFNEEIGRIKLFFERRSLEDVRPYVTSRTRIQLLLELADKIGMHHSDFVAYGKPSQDIIDLFNRDPFFPKSEPKTIEECLWRLQVRAAA